MSEYLPSSPKRNECAIEELEIPKVGDLILLNKKETQYFSLRMREVLELIEAQDTTARSVLVKTATEGYKRLVVKLIPVRSDRR